MRGRGGDSTRTPVEAEAEWKQKFATIREQLDQVEAEGIALLRASASVGEALDRSQPPMYRRMVVRWWRLSGGGRRRPVLARVEAGGKSHVKLEIAHPNHKLRTDRGFGLCADLARRAVSAFWALHAERRELDSLVLAIGRTLRRGEGRRRAVIEQISQDAPAISAEARDRLASVGYIVPDEEAVPDDTY